MQNMLVETDGLDQIRPSYKATLEIRSKDEPFSVSVACKGKPNALVLYGYSLHMSVLQKLVVKTHEGLIRMYLLVEQNKSALISNVTPTN